MTYLALALLLCVDCDDDARAALALAAQAAQHKKADPLPPVMVTPEPKRSYESLSAEAIQRGIPLVVGVRCVPAVPGGWLAYEGDFDQEECGLIVGVPRNGALVRIDLPAGASVLRVRAAVDVLKASWMRQAALNSIRARPRFSCSSGS